jgi:hypothetical protein
MHTVTAGPLSACLPCCLCVDTGSTTRECVPVTCPYSQQLPIAAPLGSVPPSKHTPSGPAVNLKTSACNPTALPLHASPDFQTHSTDATSSYAAEAEHGMSQHLCIASPDNAPRPGAMPLPLPASLWPTAGAGGRLTPPAAAAAGGPPMPCPPLPVPGGPGSPDMPAAAAEQQAGSRRYSITEVYVGTHATGSTAVQVAAGRAGSTCLVISFLFAGREVPWSV